MLVEGCNFMFSWKARILMVSVETTSLLSGTFSMRLKLRFCDFADLYKYGCRTMIFTSLRNLVFKRQQPNCLLASINKTSETKPRVYPKPRMPNSIDNLSIGIFGSHGTFVLSNSTLGKTMKSVRICVLENL